MFPGNPRARVNVRVIPLGEACRIVLTGDDPDFIVLEVASALGNAAIITLPNTAPIGKVFKFALVDALTLPTSSIYPDAHYADIIIPLARGVGELNSWRLRYGQRPTFVYGPNGWISEAGGRLSTEGAGSGDNIAFGNGSRASIGGVGIGAGANGDNRGVAVGADSLATFFAVAVGRSANGDSRGVAVGSSANGSYDGTAVGYGTNGYSYGVAIGGNADGNGSGVAIGVNAVGYSNGAAVGRIANGSSNGAAFGHGATTNAKDKAVALGYYSKAERYRELVKSADGASPQLQSWSMVDWYSDTIDAVATELLLGGTAAQRCVLLNNSAFQFQMQIIAGVTGGGNTSSWTVSGAIKRGATAASTVLVGTPTVTMTGQDVGAAAWAVAITADATNGSLKLTVTGAAATTIRWNATATLSEIRY